MADGFQAWMRPWRLPGRGARGGQAAEVSGYLGKGDGFVEAMVRFAHTYADVTERDHQRLLEAIAAGRLPHDPA